jgi:hypothetical protein
VREHYLDSDLGPRTSDVWSVFVSELWARRAREGSLTKTSESESVGRFSVFVFASRGVLPARAFCVCSRRSSFLEFPRHSSSIRQLLLFIHLLFKPF